MVRQPVLFPSATQLRSTRTPRLPHASCSRSLRFSTEAAMPVDRVARTQTALPRTRVIMSDEKPAPCREEFRHLYCVEGSWFDRPQGAVGQQPGPPSIRGRVAFRSAGDESMDCRGEERYQRPTTTPRLPSPAAGLAGGSRSRQCNEEVFLLQPPELAQGKQAPLCLVQVGSLDSGFQ